MLDTYTDAAEYTYNYPGDDMFLALKGVEREAHFMAMQRAEALSEILLAHLSPLSQDSTELRAVFNAEPGAAPAITGQVPHEWTDGDSGQEATSGLERNSQTSIHLDDTVPCVAVPGRGTFAVKAIEKLVETLPSSTIGALSEIMDCTGPNVITRARKTTIATLLMPKLWSLVKQGVVSFDRLMYTVSRVSYTNVCIPHFDELLTARRVDVTYKTYRKHVNEILAMLTSPQSRNDDATRNRTVQCWDNGDGTSTLNVTGPTLHVQAFFQRLRGSAKAIKSNHIDPFTTTLDEKDHKVFFTRPSKGKTEVRVGDLGKVVIDEERLMNQLMFDLLLGSKPSTTVRARIIPTRQQAPTRVETAERTGDREGVTELSKVPVFEDRWEANRAQNVHELELCISMPTDEEWLKSQASINLTVPLIHLCNEKPPGKASYQRLNTESPSGKVSYQGLSNESPPGQQQTDKQTDENLTDETVPDEHALQPALEDQVQIPVMLNNRIPIDPQTADQVLLDATWLYRMFTDPQTGVVLESTPTKYRVTAPLKRTLEARWVDCSAPWCPVPARVCEKDHIEPFNHAKPTQGGQTVLENLHPLCKKHHQEKTQKRINVTRREDGSLAWEFPRIGTRLVYPPESRINQAHYEQLLERFDTGDIDASHSIEQYLKAEREARERTINPEAAKRSEHEQAENRHGNNEKPDTGTAQGTTTAPVDPWAPLNQLTNDDPPPF
ncbi:HNH endonuclease signature motif containing protein [Brevibacterium sp. UMB1308A]|uniref:HNH endonuclease signature motif containing protein n=1 Tax=Brevibacterium sp. UMB1308A TaxID=3050608 RepID=UPI00254B7AA7|nr:HNH endonuclease signature motif containing protein [Brevibacterium sp. UMB1308A]MDK8346830.1 HNH endonuclease signature motif containing protein [Brevibacterium sp. UMB1308B]MDK8713978.1 HNH endonuclease signature motif containing protein [Brevibacterium sp. UMB1308A]